MSFKWEDWRTRPAPEAENTPRVAGYVLNNRLAVRRVFPEVKDSVWVVTSGGVHVGVLPAVSLYAVKKAIEARYRRMLVIARHARSRAYLDGIRTRDVS